MRALIEEERNAYNEERVKFEEETDQVKKQYETKLKLIKNKLTMMIASDSQNAADRTFDKNESIDSTIKRLQDYINFIKRGQTEDNNRSYSKLQSSQIKHKRITSNTSTNMMNTTNNADATPLKQQLVNIFGSRQNQVNQHHLY